jgi:exodeoxyribonuclease VII large subunit
VSQLNDRVASVVDDAPTLHSVRCCDEITDLHQNSTALYFTLTDGDAELPCMIWANRYRNMEDGVEVILRVISITTWKKRLLASARESQL